MFGISKFFGVFTWWAGLDWTIRLFVAGALIATSTALYFLADTLWVWGWIIGGILFLCGGRSRAEKNGYRF
ncbi:hypothetical protein BVX99_03565 [bacterium F16]|nr:hypothetical protein BVX99_03565 [bacterium F16]